MFLECESLPSINISSSVEKIECGAFEKCKSLQVVWIPEVTRVEEGAFKDCPAELHRYRTRRRVGGRWSCLFWHRVGCFQKRQSGNWQPVDCRLLRLQENLVLCGRNAKTGGWKPDVFVRPFGEMKGPVEIIKQDRFGRVQLADTKTMQTRNFSMAASGQILWLVRFSFLMSRFSNSYNFSAQK